MHTRDIWNICLQTYINNRICWKVAHFLRKIQTSRVNNSRIFKIENGKFSGYCFYTSPSIQWSFQNCISVSLTTDHSPVTILISRNKNRIHGHGFWKINSSLLSDQNYVRKTKNLIQTFPGADLGPIWQWSPLLGCEKTGTQKSIFLWKTNLYLS